MSNIKPWKELSREQAFRKYSRVIDKVMFKMPDGSEHDYYINTPPAASTILALTEANQVILVRIFRPGPNKVLLELPGGFIDPNEDPAVTAAREFREETGYEGSFEFIGTCLDDAYSTMERYCYVAKNCKKVGVPQHTATEETEAVLMSVDEFRKHLRTGQMTDVEVGYLGLDYLELL